MDRAVCIGNAKEFRFHSELEIYKGNYLTSPISYRLYVKVANEMACIFVYHLNLSSSYLGIPDLIRKMLQPNPSDRPTIEDIYQTIQSAWE